MVAKFYFPLEKQKPRQKPLNYTADTFRESMAEKLNGGRKPTNQQ